MHLHTCIHTYSMLSQYSTQPLFTYIAYIHFNPSHAWIINGFCCGFSNISRVLPCLPLPVGIYEARRDVFPSVKYLLGFAILGSFLFSARGIFARKMLPLFLALFLFNKSELLCLLNKQQKRRQKEGGETTASLRSVCKFMMEQDCTLWIVFA